MTEVQQPTIVKRMFSNIRSFHILFQNGTNWTCMYIKLEVYYLLKMLLKIGRRVPGPYFNIHNSVGLKLLTRLRVGLSHLNEHKFKYSFSNYVNPLYSCSLQV